MDLILWTDPGFELACQKEIKELIGKTSQKFEGYVEVASSKKEAALLSYRTQTARRVLQKISQDFTELSSLTGTFKVEGEDQEEIERVGGEIHRKLGLSANLTSPDHVIYAKKIVGLDLLGKDLSKRDWRIMLHRKSIRSTVAASTVLLSGVSEGEVILDPFARDGSIAIEAALFLSKTSPRKFEKLTYLEEPPVNEGTAKVLAFNRNLNDVKAVRMNSKLAGVEKFIKSTKISADWLTIKLAPESVDRIITHPPSSSKTTSKKKIARELDALFQQDILKTGGTITCLTDKPEELDNHTTGYERILDQDVLMGKRKMKIRTYEKLPAHQD